MGYIEGTAPFLLFLLSAFIHELGHFCAIKKSGGKIGRVDIMPLGARIVTTGLLSHKQDMLIFFAGPFCNLMSFVISLAFFFAFENVYILFFSICSLFLALVNLLPLKGNDGYNFIKSFLSHKYGEDKSAEKLKYGEISAKWAFFLLSALCVYLSDFNSGIICLAVAANIYKKD